MKRISHQDLLHILDYDKMTGIFTWKNPLSRRVKRGMVAGSSHSKGYVSIRVQGVLYFGHVLAWFYVYKVWPKTLLDHVDTDKKNNRISNLRESSHSQNAANAKVHKDSVVPLKGVRKIRQKYEARISVQGCQKNLGVFDNPEDAGRAYDKAAVEHFGQYALTNKDMGLL